MKKVFVVGLPYFSRKIGDQLNQFDADTNYLVLNTYYDVADRLKFLVQLPTASTIYSINGVTHGSAALDIAFAFNKKIVFHWVGTDLELARQAIDEGKAKEMYIKRPIHITDTPWYVERLAELGIDATFIPLLALEADPDIKSFPEQFTVLTYIKEGKEDFYGLPAIIELAKHFTQIEFRIAGMQQYMEALPSNIKLLGWVKDMKKEYQQATCCIRIPKHDGLSFFVLEALQQARYVIYNQPFDAVISCTTQEEIIQNMQQLFDQWQTKQLALNLTGKEFVETTFEKNKVLNDLKEILTR